MKLRGDTKEKLAEPCGDRNPWIATSHMTEERCPPCGRPKGHSTDGGQWNGGHEEKPRPTDPPTKRYVREWVVR